METLDNFEFANDELKQKRTILRINFMNALCMILKELRSRTNNMIDSRDYLTPEYQLNLMHETWDLHAICNKS